MKAGGRLTLFACCLVTAIYLFLLWAGEAPVPLKGFGIVFVPLLWRPVFRAGTKATLAYMRAKRDREEGILRREAAGK